MTGSEHGTAGQPEEKRLNEKILRTEDAYSDIQGPWKASIIDCPNSRHAAIHRMLNLGWFDYGIPRIAARESDTIKQHKLGEWL